jgi:hypothetical protein
MTTSHARIQRIRHTEQDTPVRSDLSTALASPTAGRPMETDLRAWLENGFGHDFANVRIHADGEADALARSVQASAFTTGQDIYFRAGAYDPDSADGRKRIAHEAAHVRQQESGPVAGTTGADGVSVSSPDDSFEQAAEAQADAVVGGSSLSHASHAPSTGDSAGGDHSVQRSFMGGLMEDVMAPMGGGGGGGGWESAGGGGGGWESAAGGGGGGGFAAAGESAGSMLGGLAGGFLGGGLLGDLGSSAGSALGGALGGAAGGGLDTLGGMASSAIDSVGGLLGGGELGGIADGISSVLGGAAGGIAGPLMGGLGGLLGDACSEMAVVTAAAVSQVASARRWADSVRHSWVAKASATSSAAGSRR